jgi:hypothetical protein
LVRYHIAVDIHRCADVRVPHQFLQHGYWRSHSGKGNDWLPLTSCNNSDYPCATPTNLTLSVVSSGLPVGSYYAEINIFEDSSPSQSMTIQVVLNVVN